MHLTTGRWKLGLGLALVTACCWGALPIALKLALQDMDAYSITWYRFAAAAAVLAVVLAATGRWPSLRGLGLRVWILLAVALGGLAINYVLYVIALDLTTPAVAQVVIQLAPMFLLLGSLAFFRERFSVGQWIGFSCLLLGLALFFNRRLPDLMHISSKTGFGVFLMVISAVAWAAYALAQKQLLRRFRSQQVLLLVFLGSVAVTLPMAHVGSIAALHSLQAWMLAFACANTLVAYGCFAEALEHWDASRVSAVLAVTPLLTLVDVWLVDHFFPGLLTPENLNLLSVLGALLVVGGSILCVLAKSPSRAEQGNVAMLE